VAGQPLRAPAVIPATKNRWKRMNRRRTGSSEKSEPTMSSS
jgi:hypothetical protein